MAKVNIARLKKDEIIKMYKGRCKHGHRYIEHPDCYIADGQHKIRIGFFDIETSNFKADWAIVLSYSILDDTTDKILGRAITPEELGTGIFDKRLVADMITDFKNFDLIVGYYSTKFDVPFARTRAMINGIEGFPKFGELQHQDVYYVVRSKFGALSSRRQENAARMLLGKTEKTHINPTIWLRALIMHEQKSIDFIWDHNNRDVRDLKGIYYAVIPYIKNVTQSI